MKELQTWFGTRAELEFLIGTAHSHQLGVIDDIVFSMDITLAEALR